MTATVHDLLTRRSRHHKPALHFETDLEALSFAALRIDELRETATSALLIDTETLQLPLDQAAAIIRACMRVHSERSEDMK